jgi:hypothetical protein
VPAEVIAAIDGGCGGAGAMLALGRSSFRHEAGRTRHIPTSRSWNRVTGRWEKTRYLGGGKPARQLLRQLDEHGWLRHAVGGTQAALRGLPDLARCRGQQAAS